MKKKILIKWPIKLLIILLTAVFSYTLFTVMFHMFFSPMTPANYYGNHLIRVFRSEASAMETLPGDLLEIGSFDQILIRIDNIDGHPFVVGYNPLYEENGSDYVFFVYNKRVEPPSRSVLILKKDHSIEREYNLEKIKKIENFILYTLFD